MPDRVPCRRGNRCARSSDSLPLPVMTVYTPYWQRPAFPEQHEHWLLRGDHHPHEAGTQKIHRRGTRPLKGPHPNYRWLAYSMVLTSSHPKAGEIHKRPETASFDKIGRDAVRMIYVIFIIVRFGSLITHPNVPIALPFPSLILIRTTCSLPSCR